MNDPATSTVYTFVAADYFVIFGYLLLLPCVGLLMKRLCGGSRDFLIGGNKIPWWLAGASVFMMSFSAWTFTGAAGFAYEHGIRIILIFYFSLIGYLVAGWLVAGRIRQTRLVTYGQIIYERFGRFGEQFFIWLQFPKMLFGGAIWLLGLSIFVAVAFGVPMEVTILVTGAVILIYSTLSGSWAVMTTDFVQSIILMVLSLLIAVLTLLHPDVRGLGGLFSQMPADNLRIVNVEHSWLWLLAYFLQMGVLLNSVIGANKFLAVRDGACARKTAWMAAGLFMLGPLIWFIPPFAASFMFPDIDLILGGLNHPRDGAYVLMGLHLLPAGLVGLMVMVIFAATLSSMDTAINVNAGILSMNVYKPFFRPDASEQELLLASRIFNVFCGLLVILTAYLLSQLESLNLFDLMLIMLSVLGLPMAVPCVLLYFYRRTPRWPAAVSVLLGGGFSLYGSLNGWNLQTRVFGILIISILVFSIARFFWHKVKPAEQAKINAFYDKMETPVDASREVVGSEDTRQLILVGTLAMVFGGGLFCVALFPASIPDRLIILIIASAITSIGLGLRSVGLRSKKRELGNGVR